MKTLSLRVWEVDRGTALSTASNISVHCLCTDNATDTEGALLTIAVDALEELAATKGLGLADLES